MSLGGIRLVQFIENNHYLSFFSHYQVQHFYQVIFYFLRNGRHYISAFPVFYLRLQFLPLQAECVIRFYLYRGIQPLHNVAQFDDGTYFRLVTSQKMHCDKCSQHTCQNKESYILFIIDSKISKNSRKH